MATDNNQLSEVICTRISHDLIGNIGAVANAVELLEEGDLDFLDDIRAILKTGSQVLSARLKFFRMAFGLNNANLEDHNLVDKTCRDYLKTIGNQKTNIELELNYQSSSYVKMIMASIMAMADLIIRDGKINIQEHDCKLYVNVLSVSTLSEQKKIVLTTLLSGVEQEYQAQYAPVFYLKKLLHSSGLSLHMSEGDNYGFVIE